MQLGIQFDLVEHRLWGLSNWSVTQLEIHKGQPAALFFFLCDALFGRSDKFWLVVALSGIIKYSQIPCCNNDFKSAGRGGQVGIDLV